MPLSSGPVLRFQSIDELLKLLSDVWLAPDNATKIDSNNRSACGCIYLLAYPHAHICPIVGWVNDVI